jgi:hypothetical protein
VKDINLIDRTEYIKTARAKYDAYDTNTWIKAYFDEDSGGFNVYHKEHKFTKACGGSEAEKIVGRMLAKYNDKQVEFLPEGKEKSADLMFDGHTWDIKYIDKSNEETIRAAIRDCRKAHNAIFYFTQEIKYKLLCNAITREAGRFLKGQIKTLPDIYMIDKNGILKLLWEKQKGTN